MWAGLNGFDPRNNFVLGGVRIGMDCMNLVTVISEYTQVPVTLMTKESSENVVFLWRNLNCINGEKFL